MRTGLASFYPGVVQQTTTVPELDNKRIGRITLYYVPDITMDRQHIREELISYFSALAIPTPERAIVDNIRHQDIFEEYFLVEALKSYMDKHGDNEDGLALLRQVADEYGQAEQLEYWLEEARNDWEV